MFTLNWTSCLGWLVDSGLITHQGGIQTRPACPLFSTESLLACSVIINKFDVLQDTYEVVYDVMVQATVYFNVWFYYDYSFRDPCFMLELDNGFGLNGWANGNDFVLLLLSLTMLNVGSYITSTVVCYQQI